ncbi:MAG: chemotaxis protein CheW [Pyrinomonadaceae bacterium]|nr:chemotaxis protein CheW [Pyrinomonadaceae bacterium]
MLENHSPSSNLAADTVSQTNTEDDYTELLRQMQSSLTESYDDFESEFECDSDTPMPTLLMDESDAPLALQTPQTSSHEEIETASETVSNENVVDDGWSMPEFPAFGEVANGFHKSDEDFSEDSPTVSAVETMPASFTKDIETQWFESTETSNAAQEISPETLQIENVAAISHVENPVEPVEDDSSKVDFNVETEDSFEAESADVYFDDASELESASNVQSESAEKVELNEVAFSDADDFDFDEMPEMPDFLVGQNVEAVESDEKVFVSESTAQIERIEQHEENEKSEDYDDALTSFSMPQMLREEPFTPEANFVSYQNGFQANETMPMMETLDEDFAEPSFAQEVGDANSEVPVEQNFDADYKSFAEVSGDVDEVVDSADVSTETPNVIYAETNLEISASSENLLEMAEINESSILSTEHISDEIVENERVSHFDEIENLVDDKQIAAVETLKSNALNEPRTDLAKFSFADEQTLMSFLDNLDRNSFASNSEPLGSVKVDASTVSINLEEKHIVFKLDENLFAFSAADVMEIAHPLKVTPLPFVPSWLTGVTNLRGDILAVVDLRRLWNKESAMQGANKTKMLVLRSRKENLMMGLVVDSVREMCVLPEERASVNVEQTTAINNLCGGYLQSARNLDGDAVWLLNAENFLAMAQEKANC